MCNAVKKKNGKSWCWTGTFGIKALTSTYGQEVGFTKLKNRLEGGIHGFLCLCTETLFVIYL